MMETVHGQTRNGGRDAFQPKLGGKFASTTSDTTPPDVPKPAGLGEDEPALTDSGGSDTNSGDKTKTGLGED